MSSTLQRLLWFMASRQAVSVAADSDFVIWTHRMFAGDPELQAHECFFHRSVSDHGHLAAFSFKGV